VYKILQKQVLSDAIKLIIIKAPLVAARALAGQFVIVRLNESGERIPLTIADSSPAEGTITLIFQEVGKSTMQMGQLEPGDGFENVVGPLGRPTQVKNYGKVVLLGGGVGVAPLFPIARALKEAGNTVISIIGARTKALLFWEERMRRYSDRLIVCTDDGTYGRRALVTGPLKDLLESEKDLSRAWAIGPAVMMKFVAETTRPARLPTLVSLNTIMIDGTGMCGGCRVVLDDGAQFVCVDGPEFDAHRIDWNNLLERLSFYREEERMAVERWQRHVCNLDLAFEEMVR
jgi:ferredoxin/flavodoxin---NADP+ reductase